MKRIILTIGLTLFSMTTYANIDCGEMDIAKLYVIGDRPNVTADYAKNSLFVELGSDKICNVDFVYLENTAPAYDSILAMLMSAKVSDKKIRIEVGTIDYDPGTSAVHKIEFVNFN